jgi:hypothetical protein
MYKPCGHRGSYLLNYWSRQDMERLAGALSSGVPRIELVQESIWHACITKTP